MILGFWRLIIFFKVNGSQSLGFAFFLFPFGLQESNFSAFIGTELIKLS